MMTYILIAMSGRPDVYQPPHSYQTPLAPATSLPRDLSLKLDQQHSSLRVGESTEVECYSSDKSYSDVIWEREDGKLLPPHIQVKFEIQILTLNINNYIYN